MGTGSSTSRVPVLRSTRPHQYPYLISLSFYAEPSYHRDMVRFRNPEAAKAAALLGVTEQDLASCVRGESIEECRLKLDELKKRVKKSYRKVSLDLHPDRTRGDEEKLKLFKVVSRLCSEIQKMEIGSRPRAPRPRHHTNTTTTTWGGWRVWRDDTTGGA